MPPSSILPARPNLEHLRNQAKDLLKAYRSGDPSAIARFRASLPRYSLLTDDDLRRLSLSLGDAQRVIAAEYGFPNWLHLRHYVERKDGANMIEMTVDHVRVNNVTNLRMMVLKEKGSDRYLPIWIGQAEGDAIAMRLEGQEIPRPLTHRIMDTMIRDMGGEVERVVVSDLVDDTFFAVVRSQERRRTPSNSTRGRATPSPWRYIVALRCSPRRMCSTRPERSWTRRRVSSRRAPWTARSLLQRHRERHMSERFRGILEVAGMTARGMSRYVDRA